jgi:hypothetical protein
MTTKNNGKHAYVVCGNLVTLAQLPGHSDLGRCLIHNWETSWNQTSAAPDDVRKLLLWKHSNRHFSYRFSYALLYMIHLDLTSSSTISSLTSETFLVSNIFCVIQMSTYSKFRIAVFVVQSDETFIVKLYILDHLFYHLSSLSMS